MRRDLSSTEPYQVETVTVFSDQCMLRRMQPPRVTQAARILVWGLGAGLTRRCCAARQLPPLPALLDAFCGRNLVRALPGPARCRLGPG